VLRGFAAKICGRLLEPGGGCPLGFMPRQSEEREGGARATSKNRLRFTSSGKRHWVASSKKFSRSNWRVTSSSALWFYLLLSASFWCSLLLFSFSASFFCSFCSLQLVLDARIRRLFYSSSESGYLPMQALRWPRFGPCR
jgi:hypothetical protein